METFSERGAYNMKYFSSLPDRCAYNRRGLVEGRGGGAYKGQFAVYRMKIWPISHFRSRSPFPIIKRLAMHFYEQYIKVNSFATFINFLILMTFTLQDNRCNI